MGVQGIMDDIFTFTSSNENLSKLGSKVVSAYDETSVTLKRTLHNTVGSVALGASGNGSYNWFSV